jgi:hypothetical protein
MNLPSINVANRFIKHPTSSYHKPIIQDSIQNKLKINFNTKTGMYFNKKDKYFETQNLKEKL